MIVNRCKCHVNNGAGRPLAHVADIAPNEARVTGGRRRTMKTAANLRAAISGRVDLHGRFFAVSSLSFSCDVTDSDGNDEVAWRAIAKPTQHS